MLQVENKAQWCFCMLLNCHLTELQLGSERGFLWFQEDPCPVVAVQEGHTNSYHPSS